MKRILCPAELYDSVPEGAPLPASAIEQIHLCVRWGLPKDVVEHGYGKRFHPAYHLEASGRDYTG
ncbi:MAG: hypothetical protein PHX68_03905 [Alphaproteobacteria bacterium]|nr:hypothetical protein [Alphaproteobacteria bacterium]